MSEAELVEFQEDITIRSRTTANANQIAGPASPASSTSASKSLPSYELDEDPMDGTTALPIPSNYPVSYAPDSMDDQALPAFPLEDSVPAGPRSKPPSVQTDLRHGPLPQISLTRSSNAAPDSLLQPISSQSSLGTQKFSRPSFRGDQKDSDGPATAVSRTMPPTSSAPSMSERPKTTSWRPPSIGPRNRREPDEQSLDSNGPPPIQVDDNELLPSISMDDLEETSEETAFAHEEPETSVVPQTPSATAAANPSVSAAASNRPASIREVLRPSESPQSSSLPLRLNALPTIESRPRHSEPISAAPVHLDRETPIPSSASALKGISIRGIVLSDVRGLCDLPEDSHRLLRQRARVERMGTGEDLSFFSVVLVLEGWVKLMPAIADVTCATAAAGEVVFTQGTLEDGVALRVVAGQNGTTLATWDRQTFESITESCPWVADELRLIADSFQALAGTALGMLGERLDDALREVVTSRCQVLTLLPHEVLVVEGKTVPGMHIVGAGLIEQLDSTGSVVSTVAPGDFLLTAQVLAGGVSPYTVRAASSGALVLFAPRLVAHELLVSVPPLLEILAG